MQLFKLFFQHLLPKEKSVSETERQPSIIFFKISKQKLWSTFRPKKRSDDQQCTHCNVNSQGDANRSKLKYKGTSAGHPRGRLPKWSLVGEPPHPSPGDRRTGTTDSAYKGNGGSGCLQVKSHTNKPNYKVIDFIFCALS